MQFKSVRIFVEQMQTGLYELTVCMFLGCVWTLGFFPLTPHKRNGLMQQCACSNCIWLSWLWYVNISGFICES